MKALKSTLKFISITILAITLWVIAVVYGTLNGWWHKPITQGNTIESYFESSQKKINSQFVGNFAMAT